VGGENWSSGTGRGLPIVGGYSFKLASWKPDPATDHDEKTGKRFKTVELIVEKTDWLPPLPKYNPDALVPLRIAAENMQLWAKVKAVGGRWFPDELLWYVRYGAIVGGPLEKHIHIDGSKKTVKSKKHLQVDN